MSAFYGSFRLSLTLKAPFLIAGTNPADFGVDISQIRNHRRCAVIPDSHVKGVLRHAWVYRGGGSTGISADQLFGQGGGDIDNSGGRIWFTDLVAQDAANGTAITRVAIDPRTGAAKSGGLFVIEQVARPGETVCFSGVVTIRTRNRAEAQSIIDELKNALQFVSSIGKFKTAGFGRLVGRETGDLQEIPRIAARKFAAGHHTLSFQVNKPLLVDTTRPDGNMFLGSEIITGGTIKGALAAKLKAGGHDPMNGDLGAALSMMTISHGFPDAVDTREPDLDVVQRHGDFIDLKDIDTKSIKFSDEREIPRFAPDFKGSPARAFLGREFRTHVAIDADSGSALASALFSASNVLHEYQEQPNTWKSVTWKSTIGFPDTATPKQLDAFVVCTNELEHGLFTLGKTKARTTATTIRPASAAQAAAAPAEWRVVLDTPLLMLREYHLSSEALYWAAIGAYWDKATNGCYELKLTDGLPEIYAQQSFASGYQQLKFAFFGSMRVEPFVLTKPGSVFVLDCIDQIKASAVRSKLEQTGLPVAQWTLPTTLDRSCGDPGSVSILEQPDFSDCPFGPQNGYGQIRREGAT